MEGHQLVNGLPGRVSQGDGGTGVGGRSQLTALLDQPKEEIGHLGRRLVGDEIVVLFTSLEEREREGSEGYCRDGGIQCI